MLSGEPAALLLWLTPLQVASVHNQAVDILTHGVKYLMRCHDAAGRNFVVQIGEPADYVVDTSRAAGFWGLPDHMPANRCVCARRLGDRLYVAQRLLTVKWHTTGLYSIHSAACPQRSESSCRCHQPIGTCPHTAAVDVAVKTRQC